MSDSSESTNDIDAVDMRGWTALHYAAEKGDVSEVERLLAAGANVGTRTLSRVMGFVRNSTPLIVATQRNHSTVIRLLVDLGADIDARNDHGYVSETLRAFQF